MEKLTSKDLENIGMGLTETFNLPNAKACDNGKALAYQYQNQLGCKFSIQSDYANSRLTITKKPA